MVSGLLLIFPEPCSLRVNDIFAGKTTENVKMGASMVGCRELSSKVQAAVFSS